MGDLSESDAKKFAARALIFVGICLVFILAIFGWAFISLIQWVTSK